MTILSALGDIFDVKMYPSQNLQQHATVTLETILERFSPDGMDRVLIERNRTQCHFSEFKLTLKAHNPANFMQACKLVILNHSKIYPDFAVLAHICITIPISSVPCERGFSYQNFVKTANRSRLTDKHTNNLMRIAIDSPGLDQSMDLINKARIEFNERCNRWK